MPFFGGNNQSGYAARRTDDEAAHECALPDAGWSECDTDVRHSDVPHRPRVAIGRRRAVRTERRRANNAAPPPRCGFNLPSFVLHGHGNEVANRETSATPHAPGGCISYSIRQCKQRYLTANIMRGDGRAGQALWVTGGWSY